MPDLANADRQAGPHTWEDFIALDEDDLRELVDGWLLEIEVPKLRHEHAVMIIAYYLTGWARAHGAHALPSGYKVRITKKRGVMPDAQLYRKENLPDLSLDDGLAQGHPDLVVEVVSKSSRRYDRVTKLAWYASIGVPEYWIVDPEPKTLERLVLDASGHYVIAEGLAFDATFSPPSFEGLTIPLAELWAVPASGK